MALIKNNLLNFLVGWIIFSLVASWFYSGWPQIWRNPQIPPKPEQVYAATIDVSLSAKHANDDTTEALSEITADDATCDPDSQSGVAASDGCYTVDKNKIMQFDTFDVSDIPSTANITAAVLHLEYGAENGYNGTNCVRYDNGGGLTNTTICPSDISGWSGDLTYDLYAQGVDTRSEIENLDIEFTSNDSKAPNAINFDYIWITVTYTVPTFEQSGYRLFNNNNSTDVGTALANENTAATLSASGDAFRLRLLLHIATTNLSLGAGKFELQFAEKSGTCDTNFSGENYDFVTDSTTIAYNDNSTPADGASLTDNVNDPSHGTDSIINQSYEELNPATNSVAAINVGEDGLWDFSLKDNGAPASTGYCFRLVEVKDINGASYDNASTSVGGQDSGPENITFNNDGTKMYMVGGTNDAIYQYTLSTAWDITTASYDNASTSVGGQERMMAQKCIWWERQMTLSTSIPFPLPGILPLPATTMPALALAVKILAQKILLLIMTAQKCIC
jgi:hypothetical protein